MSHQSTVFVIDDDEDVRESLRWLFQSVSMPVEVFASAAEFLAHPDRDGPGCLVLDVRMPEMDGLELLEVLRTHRIGLPAIMISGHADVPMAVKAMQTGAVDFIQKPVNHQDLLQRVRRALAADERFREEIGDPRIIAERLEQLTAKEREVLESIVNGSTNKAIAGALKLSVRTVETHRANLMRKLGVHSTAGLVRVTLACRLRP
ncbi:response regulator transcription factor [Thiocapsa marina]|uniref:Two component transcriptional regulator, LuxR family n=1 Tax=Thiocapsa marina 5811 TaxID=768671 RepID=F9U5D9_9GAMM|nr:response regulator [Thiocapsa marina]EGV20362.1 two component transcriptional regulator, LuxR family [Thiocapsa marina 5811]